MQHCIGRRKKDERKNRINETIASTTQRHKCMSVRIFGTPTLSFEVGKKNANLKANRTNDFNLIIIVCVNFFLALSFSLSLSIVFHRAQLLLLWRWCDTQSLLINDINVTFKQRLPSNTLRSEYRMDVLRCYVSERAHIICLHVWFYDVRLYCKMNLWMAACVPASLIHWLGYIRFV